MKIATQRLLSHISKPTQTATVLLSTTRTSLSFRPSFKHFCVVSYGPNRTYFSTAKEAAVEEADQEFENESNLEKYIKNPKTIDILKKKGIKTLFPIQIETFTAVYEKKDVLASDRTGSGKTIAYSLPILEKLRDSNTFKSGDGQVKFLIMCPTRELALQVFKEVSWMKHTPNDFNVVAVYGGASIEDQIRELNRGVDVIVATPGRLMDLVERKTINFSELVATCIDEADQMLEKGFKLDIEEIYGLIEKQANRKTQNLMFSATIPDWVDKISNQYMDKSKKRINLISKSEAQTSTTVQHYAVDCHFKDRFQCIQSLIKTYNPSEELSTIIFAETKIEVSDMAQEFGKQAAFLQGDMDQREREFNLNAFRNGKRRILIATDVASRGLDIDNVGLVIQLEPPKNTEPFIHRAGRTGRAGRNGICITLFNKKKNLDSMLRIENEANITFKHIAKPQIQESQGEWENKLQKIPDTLKSFKRNVLMNSKLEEMADLLISSHSNVKELVIRQLAAIAGEPPANISLTSGETGFKTYLIQMKQKNDNFNNLEILNFIKDNLTSLEVTNVHVQSSNILFDIPENYLTDFIEVLEGENFKKSSYEVKEASTKEKQMASLKQLARSQGSLSSTNDRDGGNSGNRKSRSANTDQTSGKVFITGLPEECQEGDLVYVLKESGIKFDSVKLKKKAEGNVFAFVQISDEKSFKSIISKGIDIDGARVRIASQDNSSQSGRTSGGRNSYDRSSGFERNDNYENRGRNQRNNESDY